MLPSWKTKGISLCPFHVETSGDTNMASGLPIHNGAQHADEIATMSLYLLRATTHFQTGHVPQERLQLRTGLHTGRQNRRQNLICILSPVFQGKGEQTTFWLRGKGGFTVPLAEFTEEEEVPEIL
ncbi:Guanylate cyclase 2G [Lemmus lemmus]